MLENTLVKISYILKENKLLSNDKIEILNQFLKDYKVSEYIYPGALIAKLDISSSQTYDILRGLEKNEFISKSFEIYCADCGEFKGKIYDSFSEIPEKIYCNDCLRRLDPIDDAIVIYRIIRE